MSTFKWFASFVLAATIVPALPAEPHCPGNVASVPFRLTNSHQMIVAVSVNHSGPYNFLLDTGNQITMVDPSLAAELHLNSLGSALVAGFGFWLVRRKTIRGRSLNLSSGPNRRN